MKILTTFAFLLGINLISFSQILTPVKWQMNSQQVGDNEFELVFTAKIDEGWKIYSQYLESDDGPIPTSFNFEEGDHYEMIGKIEEAQTNRKKAFDRVFKMELITFTKEGTFTQKVKIHDYSKPIVGYLEFMCCDATRCLPPSEEDFEFTLVAKQAEKEKVTVVEEAETKPIEKPNQPTEKTTTIPEKIAENQPIETPKKVVPQEEIAKKSKITNQAASTSQPTTNSRNEGILDPAKWSLKVEKISDAEYDLTFTANMKKGWYIYSQFTDPDGPVPTGFFFTKAEHYELAGEAKEIGEIKEGPEPVFDNVIVRKFTGGKATFVQRVKTQNANKAIEGFLEYMACDNEMCTPPTPVDFKVIPQTLLTQIGSEVSEHTVATVPNEEKTNFDDELVYQECGHDHPEASKSLWSIFVLGFLGGLIALLTPCVFPMIPLTVSFFTKSSENKSKGLVNAFLYGFFILLVYLILSIPFHLMDSINPDILNEISTNVWLNVIFFLVFMFFAGSFFGYYELTLPSSWVSKSSSAEGIGGLLGIFFMALTLALVSFSCTGPILGSLLAGALTSDGGAWQLTAGMGGFGLALALPFAIFAAFPTLMNALPKSGGWLNVVKVVLGFLEVAAAFKFLSNADLVSHWGVLKIEPILIIWALTFLGLGLYLFGKIKFPHDSPIKKLGFGRIAFGLASFAFTLYLLSGLLYDKEAGSLKSLTLLSGLAPPACYSILYPCECPQNLNCFKDYEQGISHAQKVDKPILLDFTGYACVNCRKMEENVWPIDKVYEQLKEKYILVSLYVDDKKELPEVEKIEVKRANGTTRKLRNYGHKWAHFQAARFKSNTQPFYVLLSPDGKTILNQPVGYTPDEDEYAAFLRCGIEAYGKYKQEKGAIGMK